MQTTTHKCHTHTSLLQSVTIR